MQQLDIVPRLLPEVRQGTKRHTVRFPAGIVEPGPLRYVSTEDDTDDVEVWVTAVRHMPLWAVADYLGKSREWPQAVLLAGMREHYPTIEWDSTVEVVHHGPPLGG